MATTAMEVTSTLWPLTAFDMPLLRYELFKQPPYLQCCASKRQER